MVLGGDTNSPPILYCQLPLLPCFESVASDGSLLPASLWFSPSYLFIQMVWDELATHSSFLFIDGQQDVAGDQFPVHADIGPGGVTIVCPHQFVGMAVFPFPEFSQPLAPSLLLLVHNTKVDLASVYLLPL